MFFLCVYLFQNEPMQFFFRIYVTSIKSNILKPKLPVLKDVKLKVETSESKDVQPASIEPTKPIANIIDDINKENKVENKIIIKTEDDSNVMKPLNAPVVKIEKESPNKSCGKENKADTNTDTETSKIEALQKLTDNISTLVRDDTKGIITPQHFKTPSSSSLKDIGMLTTIPIAAKPSPALCPSPSRPVSNCVRILPKPSPPSTTYNVPKTQVISVSTPRTRPRHLTIRSPLPLRPNICSTQTTSHLILSAPSISRPVPSQTPVLFTTVAVPTTATSRIQSQVTTAVSAYSNAKQNNIYIRSNMILPKQELQKPVNQLTHPVKTPEDDTKSCDKSNKGNEKDNLQNKPLSRSEKVLKSAKYLNKFGTATEGGELEGKEVKKVNAMKEYIENPRILEDLEIHAAETLLQVSRNPVPKENPTATDQAFKKPLPVLSPKSPKSMPLISDTLTNMNSKIPNVPPKIIPNGLSKNTNSTLNRKIKDIKNNFESDQTKKPAFDPYDFDMSSSTIPAPTKPSPKRTVYNSSTPNKLNMKLQLDPASDRSKSVALKANSPVSTTTNDTKTKQDPSKPKDSFNLILKGNDLTKSFLNNSRSDKLDLKRSFSETERCIETEDGMLSVSLMTHNSHQHLENKKRKVEEPDVSIQLMSLNPDENNIVKKESKELKRKINEGNGNNGNKKVCFKPNGKSVDHVSEILKDKKTVEKTKENSLNTSQTTEEKSENVVNGLSKTNKTLPKLIEINAAPFPKTPVTNALNVKTQQSSLENSPKHELLTALDLSPSSKSPTGENLEPKSTNTSSTNSLRTSPTSIKSSSPKLDVKSSPPKKSSPNGNEFRSIPDLVRPEYFKMLQNRSAANNNNHLQDWYKAMTVGSIPPHPLMFSAVPTPSPESLSKT